MIESLIGYVCDEFKCVHPGPLGAANYSGVLYAVPLGVVFLGKLFLFEWTIIINWCDVSKVKHKRNLLPLVPGRHQNNSNTSAAIVIETQDGASVPIVNEDDHNDDDAPVAAADTTIDAITITITTDSVEVVIEAAAAADGAGKEAIIVSSTNDVTTILPATATGTALTTKIKKKVLPLVAEKEKPSDFPLSSSSSSWWFRPLSIFMLGTIVVLQIKVLSNINTLRGEVHELKQHTLKLKLG